MSQSSIVVQLQQESADAGASTTDLLRKALIVARKLRIEDFRQWISDELNGYDAKSEAIPAYRQLSGDLKARNPYHGWIPVMWEDLSMGERASTVSIHQSVAELEALASGSSSDGRLTIRMPHLDNLGSHPLPVYLHLSQARLLGVLSTVRNTILNWSLDLEERGILGQGLVFSIREKQTATQVHYEVNNFFSDRGQAQIQQGDQGSQVLDASGIDVSDLAHLLATIRDAVPDAGDRAGDLAEHLDDLEEQIASPSPDKNSLRKALKAIKEIVVVSGAATQVVERITEMLALLQ